MTPTTRRPARAAAWILSLLLGTGAVLAAEAPTRTRSFRATLPAQEGEIRVANLAGRIELVQGQGSQILVETHVHAAGESDSETRKLLDGMKWVRGRDQKGRQQWQLTYPLDDYRGFHYPRSNRNDADLPGFLSWMDDSQTSSTYGGKRVRIYGQRRSSVPTLYADLRIVLPAGSEVVVRNVVGSVRSSQALDGTLTVDTGSGDVLLAAHTGRLSVDTGSGDVVIGSTRGESLIDTGSGDVTVRRLIGNGLVDTGSGDVTIENVSAGKLSVDTGSGDVEVRNGAVGRLLAETGSGRVRVVAVELEELEAETGSGDVVVQSSLAKARKVQAETGSGDVTIQAGPAASFDIESRQGSGELRVRYDDADLRRSGRKVTGARRGDGQTVIRVSTGSGDCVISPHERG